MHVNPKIAAITIIGGVALLAAVGSYVWDAPLSLSRKSMERTGNLRAYIERFTESETTLQDYVKSALISAAEKKNLFGYLRSNGFKEIYCSDSPGITCYQLFVGRGLTTQIRVTVTVHAEDAKASIADVHVEYVTF
jgi:hypothetical protein